MPEEPKAEPAPALAHDIHAASDAVGDAAETAVHAGETTVISPLQDMEQRLVALEHRVTGVERPVTKTAEVLAAPVKPAERTVEAVVPEVVVKPRKAHWLQGWPKWL